MSVTQFVCARRYTNGEEIFDDDVFARHDDIIIIANTGRYSSSSGEYFPHARTCNGCNISTRRYIRRYIIAAWIRQTNCNANHHDTSPAASSLCTWTIRSFNNLCFPSRSDGANQLAWRRVWAARHRVNTVRLTAGLRADRGRRATCRLVGVFVGDQRPSDDLVDTASLITGWSVQPATGSHGDEFIITRQSVSQSDSRTQRVISDVERVHWSADRSAPVTPPGWPLTLSTHIGHSAAGQIWRRDFRVTVVDRVNHYYLLSTP